MTTQTRSSYPEDPLEGYSGLALFPRTLASVSNAPKPYEPDDLHHVHNFLKSMPLRSPYKLLEEAKAIVDSGSGISNSEIASNITSKDTNDVVAEKVNEKPRERRPAMGRKRARFSMKSQYSQPAVSLEPSLDFGKLKDPEEFFAAFEKLENAKREIQKQTGVVLTELNQQNISMAPRPRRPGILGRRPAKYKHLYSNEISSQETFDENILTPSQSNVQQEATNMDVALQEREANDAELQENELVGVNDLIARSEKRVNNLLDELLTANDEDFDGDGAINLLQEHLQIKPIHLDKLCLPDLQDVRRIDLKVSGAGLTKPRNPLSDIQNFLQGIGSKTSKKRKLAESSVPCLASPTTLESPLGSIISLKKHILQSNPVNDPFSALHVDQLFVRNASLFGSTETQTEEVNMEKGRSISPDLKSLMIEENGTAVVNTSLPAVDIEDVTCSNASLPEVAIEDVTRSSNKTVNDNLSRLSSGIGVGSSGFHDDVDGSIGGSCMYNTVVSETLGRPDADTDVQPNEPTKLNDKIQMEDVLQEALDSVQPDLNMEDSTGEKLNNHKVEDVLREALDSVQPDRNMGNSTGEKLNSLQNQLDQTSHDVAEDHAMNEPSKTVETGPEQHNEEVQISTTGPVNEQRIASSRPRKKGKRNEVIRRQSLAASGTSWESGVRRSTRIKSRPLEYWRGERFLYGRVHQSLPTVIGIKYESPGSADEKLGLKVKSFVSDEYKDLVELAARF